MLLPCSRVEEPGPRAGSWVPDLNVGRREFETSDRKSQGREALLGSMEEGSWQTCSRLLIASACLLFSLAHCSWGLHLRYVYPTRSCACRARGGLTVLEKHPTSAGWMSVTWRRAGGAGGPRCEVWKRLWPRLPEPQDTRVVTARLRLISKGLDWSTELVDSNFCKLNLSIGTGQKYGRIWQHVVVVLLLTFRML